MNARRLFLPALPALVLAFLAFTAAPALAATLETPGNVKVSAVTATTAHVSGVLNPAGGDAEGGFWGFLYGVSEPAVCGAEKLVPEPYPGAGIATGLTEQPVEETLTGLQPHAEYTVCLLELNAAETEQPESVPVPFETLPAPPTLGVEKASVTSTAATLEAELNPNNEATNYVFEYSTTEHAGKLTGTPVKLSGGPLEGGNVQAATVPKIEGLIPGTTYYYRVVAENAQSKKEVKPVEGSVQEFTTVPTPHTEVPNPIGSSTATFHGKLTLDSIETQYSFAYNVGAECINGSSAPTPPVEASTASVSTAVTELQPNQKYVVCLVTSNVFGSEVGNAVPFTTKPAPPTIESESTAPVPPTEANPHPLASTEVRLEAVVNPNNEATECHFEYELEEELLLAPTTALCEPGSFPAGFGGQTVGLNTANLGALEPNKTYYYRVVAKNGAGETKGTDVEPIKKFETALPPETPQALQADPIAPTEATLRGALNPGGERAKANEPGSYEFRYRRSATECQGGAPGEEKAAPASFAPGLKQNEPAEARVEGLQPGTQYTFCLIATNEAGEASAPSAPVTFTTLAVKPTLSGEATAGETAGTANLTAQVDPNGAATTYHFEYDTMPYHEGEAAHGVRVPAHEAEDPTIPVGNTPVAISHKIEGLSPNTEYHWRVTAANTAGSVTSGDHVFDYATGGEGLPDNRAYEMVTPPLKNGALLGNVPLQAPVQISDDGSDLIMSAVQCFDGSLSCVPAGRKGIGVPYLFSRTAAGWSTTPLAPPATEFKANTWSASNPDRQTSVFSMPTPPFGEDDFYGRGPEGVFTDIGPLSPPAGGPIPPLQFLAIGDRTGSADLSHFVFDAPPLWPSSKTKETLAKGNEEEEVSLFQYPNAGKREPALVGVSGGLGSTELISECETKLPSTANGLATPESADGRIVYFSAKRDGGGPCVGTGMNAGKEVTTEGDLFARVDGGEAEAHTVPISEPDAPQTLAEGARGYASPPDENCTEATCRENIEKEENWRKAAFMGTSSDGSKTFFESEQQLTNQATQGSNNLYLYDMKAPEGRRWVDVSAGENGIPAVGGPRVQGVLAHSNDGSHVYFVAQGFLTKTPNSEGKQAVEGGENLYLFERECPEGEPGCANPAKRTVFITGLMPGGRGVGDAGEWESPGNPANVTPDGRFLVFTSHAALTKDVTRTDGAEQVYRYDAGSGGAGSLTRVSIGERGYNDDGNAGAGNAFIVPGYYGEDRLGEGRPDPTMSNDGSRVFFMDPVALTPKALNDVPIGTEPQGLGTGYAQNVYEWEQAGVGSCSSAEASGCTFLLSDGHDTGVAGGEACLPDISTTCLLGSDASGDNVFFTTADELVKADTDTQLDAYDARVCEPENGNPCVAEPPEALPPCLGEQCHGIPAETPSLLTPGTANFNGAVNPTPAVVKPVVKPKALTRTQKLAAALKQCRKGKSKSKRVKCEKAARRKYGPVKKRTRA